MKWNVVKIQGRGYWHPVLLSCLDGYSVCVPHFGNTECLCNVWEHSVCANYRLLAPRVIFAASYFYPSLTATMIHFKLIPCSISNTTLNFSDIRISFKCSSCGGGEVVFAFHFWFRTWVPIATLKIQNISNLNPNVLFLSEPQTKQKLFWSNHWLRFWIIS